MREYLHELNTATLAAYTQRPGLISEHYGIEQVVLAGGYGYRQILELIQNGADAILEAHQSGLALHKENRVYVTILGNYLYVGNTGASVTKEGLDALLSSHRSPKRGCQIGRFGLGFKSLLRLGGHVDLFIGNDVAIRFDPDRCRQELMEKFNFPHAPGMRMAWPVDESRSTSKDLKPFSWAETIVRVEIRKPELRTHLQHEIRSFPPEFLLFFPLPVALVLEDGDPTTRREIRVEVNGQESLLQEGDRVSRWRVINREIKVTDAAALSDATHIHARDAVPIAWAMPQGNSREEAGRFWAFFPTQTPTYLPGILNAPWKLNSDRNSLIGGEWNKMLMEEAAKLIAETLPYLSTPNDPGSPLDAFPRQLARLDEDAAPLISRLWDQLLKARIIPDGTGELRLPHELWRHPRSTTKLVNKWQELAAPTYLARYVAAACLERQRASRLAALADLLRESSKSITDAPCLAEQSATQWFNDIAATETQQAVKVLQLAEAYKEECLPAEWREIRNKLGIVPTDDGQLLPPNKVIFAPPGVTIPNRASVAAELCADAGATRILREVLGVSVLDDHVWTEVLGESLLSIPNFGEAARDVAWTAFWEKIRSAPESVRVRFIAQNRQRICVRRHDKAWVPGVSALLPGQLIPHEDHSDNRKLLVDLNFHQQDALALRAVGVCEMPTGDDSDWRLALMPQLSPWLVFHRQLYKSTHKNSASRDYLAPKELTMPGGWWLLPSLQGAPKGKLTQLLLERSPEAKFQMQIKFGHSTETRYPQIEVDHPLRWFLLSYGSIYLAGASVRLFALAERREATLAFIEQSSALQSLFSRCESVQPPIKCSESDIRDMWQALITALAVPTALADDGLRELWEAAAGDNVVPSRLPSHTGDVPISDVFVTTSPDLARRARTKGHVAVTLNGAALVLWVAIGARNLAELMKPEWTHISGPPELLVTVFPELEEALRDESRGMARCQPVNGLKLIVANDGSDVPCLMWEGTLLLDIGQLALLSRAERLHRLLTETAAAGWLMQGPEEAVRFLGDSQVDERRAYVLHGPTLAEKLLRAVGHREQPLRQALGAVGELELLQVCPPVQLAQLVLAQLGPATLTTLKDTLQKEGLKPPFRWNTAEAREFVACIGFPAEFAASPESRREAEEYISGPIELPPLHDFQEEVLAGVRALVTSGTGRRRAVVSLPTGGGKTRVTVEAAVILVLRPQGNRRSVIWVAQTDELCEQAVQAFRQVWLNVGAQRTDLRVVRLWGGNPNPAIQEPDKPVVIVASIQTLNSRMGTDGLAWLRNPGLVVVDECHHAITPSYTNLLRFLDAEAPRPGSLPKDEPPILGLSATPFRTDDDESRRLARRFDNNWLPANQEYLYRHLRDQGVLAQVDNEPVDSGIGLTPEEMDRLSRLPEPWEGIDFENLLEAINQRLAGSKQRNERLVARIKKAEERSILLFANSVLHAEELAVRLNLQGIPAAAVSGTTPTVARRYFLEQFQRGELRVLCNHSVLSTGFDAPKTDMVLISRAVFSPVRYMQMVGRGLRGEKNGGKGKCRIVTVLDNLGRFQDRHPYHYCVAYFKALRNCTSQSASK